MCHSTAYYIQLYMDRQVEKEQYKKERLSMVHSRTLLHAFSSP